MEEKKRCKRCGKIKNLDEFHIDKSKKDGHKNVCKDCLSQKHYYVSNIDRNVKQSVRYFLKYDGAFRWSDVLGYTKEELMEHLREQFQEGMTFENYETYFKEVLTFVQMGDFDVLGHLDIVQRYAFETGNVYNLEDYRDYIYNILKVIISRGKGIEVNTSGLSNNLLFLSINSKIFSFFISSYFFEFLGYLSKYP